MSLLKDLKDRDSYEILIVSNCAKGLMEHIAPFFKGLRWIMAIGTGVENLLKCPSLKNNDQITLTNLKSVSGVLLAEFALLAILYFFKKIPLFQDSFQNKIVFSQRVASSPERKKVLIVGIGSIGREVALKCKMALNMEVWGVKRNLSNSEHLKDLVEGLFSLDQLDNKISEFDVVVAVLPFLTSKIFTKNTFSKMKKGAVFINLGRGSYVDESALIEALLQNHLLGAGLDVLDNEPIQESNLVYDHRLKHKLLYTYHVMDGSINIDEKTRVLVKENILNFLNGKDLVRKVNKKFGY